MSLIGNKSTPPAPFIETLWNLVDDPKTNKVISWVKEDPKSFQIKDITKLKETFLRKYYTAKWESFRRQLYFYGFKSK